MDVFRAAAIAILVSTPAAAEWIEVPFSQQVIAWNSEFDDIAAQLELSERQAIGARRIAAQWTFLGPCKGVGKEGENLPHDIVMGGSRSRFHTAVLAMISVLTRENLGRSPPPDAVCRFASEMR